LIGLALQLGLCLPSLAWQVVDDRGVRVSQAQPPARLVSLLPSLTESICALGQCQRLVGVDEYSNYPAEVRQLPGLGAGLAPNIEAIVALKPDLVLLAASSRASQRLESLGIQVLALEPRSHADLQRALQTLGQVLGLPPAQGERLWQALDAGLLASAKALSPAARRARVYFEVGRGPYAASESSFIGQTLARLGAGNVVPAALGPFPQLNPEWVVRADPDVIMLGSRSQQALTVYPGWSALRAVREGRVCIFAPDESDVLVRPGPRLVEAAGLMARCLEEKMR
jgi:iron complex transport system substrate-binding protein